MRRLTGSDREQLFDDYKAMDDNLLAIEVTRQFQLADHIHDQPRTFSEDAMLNLRDQMIVFVGARLLAHHDRTGVLPTKLRAILAVEFE